MNLEDALTGIQKMRKTIHEQDLWNDPLKLSDVMVKLSVYNCYLADHVSRLHKMATDESFKQFKLHEGLGATKAQQYAKGLSTQQRYDFENSKMVYGSVQDLLSQLQSRLRIVENSMRNNI